MQTRKPNWTHVLFWADRAPRLTVQLSGVLCSNLSSNAQNLGERERKSKKNSNFHYNISKHTNICGERKIAYTHALDCSIHIWSDQHGWSSQAIVYGTSVKS